MQRPKKTMVLSALLVMSILSSAAAAETLTEQVRERLRNRLEAAGVPQ